MNYIIIVIALIVFFIENTFAENFNYNLKYVELADGIFVIEGDNTRLNSINGGAISNTSFIIGSKGIMVIDAGPSALYAEQVISIIRSISSIPIKYLVITHHHPDHSFGISSYQELGVEIIMSSSEILRYEKYGKRLLRQMKNLIGEEWFLNTKIVDIENNKVFPLKINLGNHQIGIREYKNGHSEGDLVVVDIDEEVVFSGDLIFNKRAPTIPHANIDNWSKYIDILHNNKWKILVPGHGPIIRDKEELYMTKNWINYISKIAKEAVEKGLSPAEVFDKGISDQYKRYHLAQEVWNRDLPLLMKKYEYQ